MNSSSSIRDLYSDPSSSWSFTPATQPNAPLNSAAAVSSPGPSTWKAAVRPPHNSIFDLSPDLNDVSVADINVVQVLRTVLASAMLQYASTAIAMPWEVGKLLLQVQYVPRDVQDSGVIQEVPEEDETSDSDGEDESYFADPGVPSTQRARHEIPRDGNLLMRNQQPTHDNDSRPEYIMPIEPQDGVWGMIKRIGRFRGEGWLALWKGLLTSCITEVLSSTLQPIIHSTLHSLFLPAAATLYQQNQPVLLLPIAVTSHLLTGLVLSPLDLIRTRLIVQSFIPRYKSYTGPLDALSQILRDEGGVKGLYLHPHLLFPTILDCTLRPLVALALPGMIASYVGARHITEENNPLAWGIAELAGSCVGLLITLPFETVRRRLQVQKRGRSGQGKPAVAGCVSLRPMPYHGVVDALWRIVTEERSDVPVNRRGYGTKKRRASRGAKEANTVNEQPAAESLKDEGGLFKNTGIGQLYRGFGMRLGASVIVFALAIVSGGEDMSDNGWAEL